jgi:hypothetical protein
MVLGRVVVVAADCCVVGAALFPLPLLPQPLAIAMKTHAIAIAKDLCISHPPAPAPAP